MKLQKIMHDYVYVVIGNFLLAVGLNPLIVPLDLYSGGAIGVAQTIHAVLMRCTHMNFGQLDIVGVINFLMNVSLFILAYRSISRKFFVKTLLCVLTQTVVFTTVVIPSTPTLNDVLTACLVGGLICGFGTGLALRNGGNGGGLDILGVYFTRKFSGFSVRRLSDIINVLVFDACMTLFNVTTVIYSIIYTACMYFVVDKTHYQNISMITMIFTKEEEVQESIMKRTNRGVTYWRGAGAYTKTDTHILVMVISRYEVTQLKKIIYKIDPRVFITFSESMSISRNFEKRL